MADTRTSTNTTIGKRLVGVGLIGAVVVGVIWMSQKSSHDDGQAILSAVRDPEPFNSTPYMIAMAIAAAVFVVGLVIQTQSD